MDGRYSCITKLSTVIRCVTFNHLLLVEWRKRYFILRGSKIFFAKVSRTWTNAILHRCSDFSCYVFIRILPVHPMEWLILWIALLWRLVPSAVNCLQVLLSSLWAEHRRLKRKPIRRTRWKSHWKMNISTYVLWRIATKTSGLPGSEKQSWRTRACSSAINTPVVMGITATTTIATMVTVPNCCAILLNFWRPRPRCATYCSASICWSVPCSWKLSKRIISHEEIIPKFCRVFTFLLLVRQSVFLFLSPSEPLFFLAVSTQLVRNIFCVILIYYYCWIHGLSWVCFLCMLLPSAFFFVCSVSLSL